jgi:RNA polymerase sigma-70 factor, ECF subfamily
VNSSDAQADRNRRFAELTLPHLDAAYNLARWLSGNPADAQDVVQEAFVRALRFFDGFHGADARAWLLTIVRNTWFTEWRRRDTNPTVTLDDLFGDSGSAVAPGMFGEPFEPSTGTTLHGADNPEEVVMRDESARLVHRALDALPVAFREVLVLREFEQLSYREIAQIADVPLGTVMSRLARARQMLAASVRAMSCAAGAGVARAGETMEGRADGL